MQHTIMARKFEQFVTRYGDDPFISLTLTKMVATRLAALNSELKKVQAGISSLEREYAKQSDQFIAEYEEGRAGDAMEFIEWSSLIKMRERLIAEREALQG